MSKMHTPGEWLSMKDKHGIDAGFTVVCIVAPDRGDRQLLIYSEMEGGDDDANARLIMAAPDMLKALVKARATIRKTGINFTNVDIYNAIDGAIKKALGV